MIALDTNVVVRLMIQDDEEQLARAMAVLEPLWERSLPALIPDVVLAELEWVLEGAYRVPRSEILASLHALAADKRFVFDDRSRLLEALRRYQSGRGDLSDYLIGLAATGAGAETTLTFDRGLRDDPSFKVL